MRSESAATTQFSENLLQEMAKVPSNMLTADARTLDEREKVVAIACRLLHGQGKEITPATVSNLAAQTDYNLPESRVMETAETIFHKVGYALCDLNIPRVQTQIDKDVEPAHTVRLSMLVSLTKETPGIEKLSKREKEVLEHCNRIVNEGGTPALLSVADAMGISKSAIFKYKTSILKKLGLNTENPSEGFFTQQEATRSINNANLGM